MTARTELEDQLIGIARTAADAAVSLIHTNRPGRLSIDTKSAVTDMVTDMDRSSESLIRGIIAADRPDDLVVGEEEGTLGGADAEVTWFIDPIDGTTNYVYDHPGYNVSIAAAVEGVMTAAVVADPTHARVYSAVRGRGAWCDTTPLRLSLHAPPLDRTLVATGFGYDAGRRGRQGRVVAALLPQIRDIRRMGAAALDLCSVAAGRVDAYYETGLGPWDLAAGALIASEAGATVGPLSADGADRGEVLAAHPEQFEPLRELLLSLGAGEV